MKLEDKVGLVILIVGISFILVYPYYQWANLGEIRYAIGILKDVRGARSGWQPIFQYDVNENSFEKTGTSQYIVTPKNVKKSLGKRYYIMFNNSNPYYATILLDYPVPDSIQNPPPFGWDSIPGVGELENPLIWRGGKSPPIKKK
ncbi:MAG TPA: hypothetical protein PK239_19180 [Chitinophagales bacterium]|nr:hypothetical protein [Chitinophagales bacterium]